MSGIDWRRWRRIAGRAALPAALAAAVAAAAGGTGAWLSGRAFDKAFAPGTVYGKEGKGREGALARAVSLESSLLSRTAVVEASIPSGIGELKGSRKLRIRISARLLPFTAVGEVSLEDPGAAEALRRANIAAPRFKAFPWGVKITARPADPERGVLVDLLPGAFGSCRLGGFKAHADIPSGLKGWSDALEKVVPEFHADSLFCDAPDPSGARTEGVSAEKISFKAPLAAFAGESGIGLPSWGELKAASAGAELGYFKGSAKGVEVSRKVSGERESVHVRFDLGGARAFSTFLLDGGNDRVDEPRFRLGVRKGRYLIRLTGPLFNNKDNKLFSDLVHEGYMAVNGSALETALALEADFTEGSPKFTITANGKGVDSAEAASLLLGRALEEARGGLGRPVPQGAQGVVPPPEISLGDEGEE